MITAAAAHPTGSIGAWNLVLQLRKRRISKVILGGALANMCVESHLRNLLRKGFEPDIRFYSTKPRGPGMRLEVSRSIIEAHGGRLLADMRCVTYGTPRMDVLRP